MRYDEVVVQDISEEIDMEEYELPFEGEQKKDSDRQELVVGDSSGFFAQSSAAVSQSFDLTDLQRNLGNCLQIIDDEVMKGYLPRLQELAI